MAFIVDQMQDRQCIRLEFEGRQTTSDLQQSGIVLISVLQECNTNKILIDARQAFLDVSSHDIHQSIPFLRHLPLKDFTIAVIVQLHDWSIATQAEEAIRNLGVQMRVFRDEINALAWLLR